MLEPDLFTRTAAPIPLPEGLTWLEGFALPCEDALLEAIARITTAAPLRHLTTPGGQQMSVAMTNCGPLGWVSDRRGYHYSATDPERGEPWPALPAVFRDLAAAAARAAAAPRSRKDSGSAGQGLPFAGSVSL